VEGWHWIVYPWALHEDLTAFVEKVLSSEPEPIRALRESLKKRYRMDPGAEEIVFAIRELVRAGKAVETEKGIMKVERGP